MAVTVNTNVASLNAQRNLTGSQNVLNRSLARLSSGLRINSAKDDAAGLAISDRMGAQVRGMNQAVRNANDGISLMQTGEGALQEATNILQRVRELAVQSANDTNTVADRAQIQKEVTSLTSELDRIATTTEFNGKALFDGTFGTATFQVGANADQTITTATGNFRTSTYGNQNASGTASAGAATTRTVAAKAIVVNGSLKTGTYTTVAADTAKSIAEGINGLDTGVKASAKTELDATIATTGAYTLTIASDNATAKTVSFTVGSIDSNGFADAAKAFNDASGTTGVTAKVNAAATGVTLTNATGNDITLKDTAVANAGDVVAGATLTGDTNVDTVVVNGQVSLNSDKSFSATDAGTSGYAITGASTLQAVNTLDVTTVANATTALRIADAAIASIDNQRADFGAVQNRFESTISNLMNVSQNISAAQSRIVDADFAQETASLTKSQILQQAGMAMLSQANSIPQGALTLLQG